jgi:pyruvate dehydrogenase E2 component (dihydrolipoamide acetyltransferase)
MKTIEIKVPDIGDFKEVEIIEVMVKVGQTIAVDQSIVTVESDKASMEIPSSHAGVVKELKIKLGDKIAEGSLLLLLEPAESGAVAVPAKVEAPVTIASEEKKVPPVVAPVVAPLVTPTNALAESGVVSNESNVSHASPSARKFARELGVDLTRVKGSGVKGRITEEDIRQFVKGVMSGSASIAQATNGAGAGLDLLPWPSLDFSKFGTTELLPLSRIRKLSGPNLHRNWVMIPHVTQFDEADVTDLEAFRVASNVELAKSGVRLTMLVFLIKACVAALKKFPSFNASLDAKGENLILKQYYHIGFAADTPNGLVVPVVKNADKKGLMQIAAEMGELSLQAREGKIKPADMQGATFTISSLGGIGGTAFTPIINAPEVAILGLSKASMKPMWNGKEFVPQLMMPLSLSYDHRVIDGAMAARFTVYLGEALADMRRTLL